MHELIEVSRVVNDESSEPEAQKQAAETQQVLPAGMRRRGCPSGYASRQSCASRRISSRRAPHHRAIDHQPAEELARPPSPTQRMAAFFAEADCTATQASPFARLRFFGRAVLLRLQLVANHERY